MSSLVNPVAIHEKRVAMEMSVVNVRFVAFCDHMPPDPDTAACHHQTAANKVCSVSVHTALRDSMRLPS